MANVESRLADLFADLELVVFVGAGLSRGCNLPGWDELLDCLLVSRGHEQLAKKGHDFLRLAEYLAVTDPDGVEGLVRDIRTLFDAQHTPVSNSDAHLLISALNPHIIYTTNFDSLLEDTYDYVGRKYQKVVTVSDVSRASFYGDGPQIVKFHGSLEVPGSIVFTETAFFERLDFESPMDIKLRADLLGKSVIFLGYSFNDINVRYMFFRLQELMRRKDATPRESFIILPEFDPVTDTAAKRRGLQPVYLSDYPGNGLTEKTVCFLGRVLLKAVTRGGFSHAIATTTYIRQFESALQCRNQPDMEHWVNYLRTAKIATEQFRRLVYGEGDRGFAWWWNEVVSCPTEIRTSLSRLFVSLTQVEQIPWANELLFLGYLRYPEVRWTIDDLGCSHWYHEVTESPSEEFRSHLVSDARYWLAKGPLSRDTTLWYLLTLHHLFPDNEEVAEITTIVYEKDPGLPDIETLSENSDDMGRLCEMVGYQLHSPGEFLWATQAERAI